MWCLDLSLQPDCLHPCPENLGCHGNVTHTSSLRMLSPQHHYIQLFTVKIQVTHKSSAFHLIPLKVTLAAKKQLIFL